jgi:hypothetical protein
VIEGTQNLIEHSTNYYKGLFGLAPSNIFRMDPDLLFVHEKLDANDNIDRC